MVPSYLYDTLIHHARICVPRECVGLLVQRRDGVVQYIPGTNTASDEIHAGIDEQSIDYAERVGEVIAFVHSHPNNDSAFSTTDIMSSTMMRYPYVLVTPNGHISVYDPATHKTEELRHCDPQPESILIAGMEFPTQDDT